MDTGQARERLLSERAEVEALIRETEEAARQDRAAAFEPGDTADVAQPLSAEGIEDAVAVGLRGRREVIDRALRRLDAGTYGRSVRSGEPIPDDRLEADPAAELTVEEARSSR